MNWDFLWHLRPDGILLDDNQDNAVDGIAACVVPLTPQQFTAPVWAAAANLAARMGLESSAIRLPLATSLEAVESWQIPLLLSIGAAPPTVDSASWADLVLQSPLFATDQMQVSWLHNRERCALRLHATDAGALADLLNRLAVAHAETSSPAPSSSSADRRDLNRSNLDLAALYKQGAHGLFRADYDGFTRDGIRFRLFLGPRTDTCAGMAAIDLAARLGLETTGAILPLAFALDALPDPDPSADYALLLGFDEVVGALAPVGAHLNLTASMARYLAEVYPYLDRMSQVQQSPRSVSSIISAMDDLIYARTPLTWLALAEVQAGKPVPVDDVSDLRSEVYRLAWNPSDRLDHIGRLRRTFSRKLRARLAQGKVIPQQITIFCSAPRPLRRQLAAEFSQALATQEHAGKVRVLPVHKAGLAWLQEEQIPLLADKNVAHVDLHFGAFRPTDGSSRWLDLPHRWLQEIFPADELLGRGLGLDRERIQLHMDDFNAAHIYEIIAYNANHEVIHRAALPLLWEERPYLTGMADYGLAHPSTGGIIVEWPDGRQDTWSVKTDESLFWDFYQSDVLPSLRSHILSVSRGRPTPEWEPYFESLQVDAYFGWPDESLDVYEEFVSVGEALHEDIYFNTLDYLTALGEQFCGRPISAGGQVMPLIHDFYAADGTRILQSSPRAVVTLRAWALPRYLPPLDLVVGSRSDMPTAIQVRLSAITVDPSAEQVSAATVHVDYANAACARLAARTLARRHALAPIHMPAAVAVTVECAGGAAWNASNWAFLR